MESNLNVFTFNNVTPSYYPEVVMRNGIFAISDPASNKVMEFSSYGDVLSLYYNPLTNPPPLTLRVRPETEAQTTVVNKIAHPYEFVQIGKVAYSRENLLLVQDQVSDRRRVFDQERGVYLSQVILRFNALGEYQDYLGQEGIGGTAFPPLRNLWVTELNHIVIAAKVPGIDLIFWYDGRGDLLYSLEIGSEHLPLFEDEGFHPVLDTLTPSMTHPEIYVKVDFHPNSLDERGIQSRIYTFDLESGSYSRYFDLPVNFQDRPNVQPGEVTRIQFPYEFLGIDDMNTLFFMGRITELQQQLLLINTDGRVLHRGFIDLNEGELVRRSLRVNEQGILVGLGVYNDRAEVKWWRTDRLLPRTP